MGTLDFLELRYTVEWPLNIVITEKSIVKYNKVSCSVQKLSFFNEPLSPHAWSSGGSSVQNIWEFTKR